MHRFLPTLLRQAGKSVVEVPVGHRERHAGASKYGISNRLVPATLDLLAVCWMRKRRIALDTREVTAAPRPDGPPGGVAVRTEEAAGVNEPVNEPGNTLR